jgi:hypothetical protein
MDYGSIELITFRTRRTPENVKRRAPEQPLLQARVRQHLDRFGRITNSELQKLLK